jgi:hypothetical protein
MVAMVAREGSRHGIAVDLAASASLGVFGGVLGEPRRERSRTLSDITHGFGLACRGICKLLSLLYLRPLVSVGVGWGAAKS